MSWVRHACRVGASALVLGALAAPLSADTYYFRYRSYRTVPVSVYFAPDALAYGAPPGYRVWTR